MFARWVVGSFCFLSPGQALSSVRSPVWGWKMFEALFPCQCPMFVFFSHLIKRRLVIESLVAPCSSLGRACDPRNEADSFVVVQVQF